MRISELSVRRPVFATVLSMLLVIFGLVSLQRLSVREYPDIDRPTVSVTTGKRRPGFVEIVSGIAEHERVVVDGTQNVRDGSVVQETSTGASGSS